MHDPTDFESSVTMKKLKLKIKTISSLIKLFFALYKEGMIIVLSINSALEELYQKSSSLMVFILQFQKVLEIYKKEYCKKRDYLNHSVNIPHLQEITIIKILKMDFKLDILDDQIDFIDKQLSMYCFSPSLFPGRSIKYNDFLQTSLLSFLEEEIEQNKKFCKKSRL